MKVLAELNFHPGTSFQIIQGNLLEEPVDAIVNAANGQLAHGGGVAAIISRAAGPALQAESDRIVREQGPFPTGAAARQAGLSKVRLCLRDQPVIDAVLKELKS